MERPWKAGKIWCILNYPPSYSERHNFILWTGGMLFFFSSVFEISIFRLPVVMFSAFGYSFLVFSGPKAQKCHDCTWTNNTSVQYVPGNVVRWASRDAGFNGVGTIHTHCVKGLVFTVPKGIEVDVGLGRCSGSRLTWQRTKRTPALVAANRIFCTSGMYLSPHPLGQQLAQMASIWDPNSPPL